MIAAMDNETIDQPEWRARTLILFVIGAIAALLIQQLAAPEDWRAYSHPLPAWRDAVATGIGVGGLAFGFGLVRVRTLWTLVFASALGLVAALIVWWNGQPDGVRSYSGVSLFLALAIALPLFQVARDAGRPEFPYAQIHGHAWTNVVLWFACWAFAGLTLFLSHLIAELFALIGIDLVKDVLRHNWSNAMVIGAAFGAALAMLRDRDRVVRLLENLVTTVLGVLAPVLAAALLLFVLSLPFTGLQPLWSATKSTTPILIACVIGGLVLANAVIGHGPEDEAKSAILRWSAMILGVVILPLAVVAAIAMRLRLEQYGMTPDRLWGLTCVAFAVAYAFVYCVAIVRRRAGWAPLIRRDNIRLAFATMAIALLLATPIVGFNAISTRDQVGRLKSGMVSPEKFDWAALGFDFGQPGREALQALAGSSNPAIKTRAQAALKAESRYEVMEMSEQDEAVFRGTFDVKPVDTVLPEPLRRQIAGSVDGVCSGRDMCRVYMQPGGTVAAVIGDGCMTLPPADRVDPKHKCTIRTGVFVLRANNWVASSDTVPVARPAMTPDQERVALSRERAAIDGGHVEIRDVTQQQMFIGDKPVGQPFNRP